MRHESPWALSILSSEEVFVPCCCPHHPVTSAPLSPTHLSCPFLYELKLNSMLRPLSKLCQPFPSKLFFQTRKFYFGWFKNRFLRAENMASVSDPLIFPPDINRVCFLKNACNHSSSSYIHSARQSLCLFQFPAGTVAWRLIELEPQPESQGEVECQTDLHFCNNSLAWQKISQSWGSISKSSDFILCSQRTTMLSGE